MKIFTELSSEDTNRVKNEVKLMAETYKKILKKERASSNNQE